MYSLQIEIPDCPPSFNATGTRGHWRRWYSTKIVWTQLLHFHIVATVLPKCERIEASAVLRFPKKRRRDEGNYRTILEKVLGDVLTAGKWLVDDTPDHYRFTELSFDPEKGSKKTLITLKYEEA